MIWKALTILVLVAAIAGGTGYFVYEYHFKPKKLDIQEKAAVVEVAPTPPPDPSLVAFEAVAPLLASDTPEAVEAMQTYLRDYPSAEKAAEVRRALGQINGRTFFAQQPGPDKADYVVVGGDSLVKVASKFKTSAELIYRASGLTTINLQIGQHLLIPQIETSLVIDRAAQSVIIQNKGRFFKEYPAVSFRLPGAAASGTVESKVNDKFVLKGGNRVPFGSKDYEGSDRWILLATGGLTIRSAPAPAADDASPAPPPGGIVLSPEDAAEVFVLVNRGTPVTIR